MVNEVAEGVFASIGVVSVILAAVWVAIQVSEFVSGIQELRYRVTGAERNVDELYGRIVDLEQGADDTAENIERLEVQVHGIDNYLTAVDSVEDEEVDE